MHPSTYFAALLSAASLGTFAAAQNTQAHIYTGEAYGGAHMALDTRVCYPLHAGFTRKVRSIKVNGSLCTLYDQLSCGGWATTILSDTPRIDSATSLRTQSIRCDTLN
ncbi:hypothetical protein AJ79_05219 [Helicocarpus griseus UAMH5409]|uniref:Beta/gamma crystallin 'Greek key' domain-containing protein n=1 Tax=Helicocarpus griseus UAMH5409 TaxID=1447875 RepID=A0A2B7XPE7_9EURO|nr:hypothetical protein AJ79_05219 [Helicocarpus griseus UAMH5409]